jgi:type I site-specific restriction endonuclease
LFSPGAHKEFFYIFDYCQNLEFFSQDESMFERIRQAWDSFQPFLDDDLPPPMTEQDTVTRSDSAWQQAAKDFLGWKSVVDEAQVKVDAAKAKLVEMATHCRESGAGVSVTRYWKVGNVDYKKLPQLAGVDLEQYRGKAREEVRVTVEK